MADVGIEVSMNGQQFATVDANFSYHSPMVTAGLAPLSGPSTPPRRSPGLDAGVRDP
jgi:hypothetical protein